jgi:hypothetical protein
MQQARSLTITQQPATFVLSPQQQPIIQPQLNANMNPLLEQAVLAIKPHEYTPDRSNGIYINKMKSYSQYCNYCYPLGDYYNKVLEANNSTILCHM